jgi:hypothetical protein
VLVYKEGVVVLQMADARKREVIKTIFKHRDNVNMFVLNSSSLKVGLIQALPAPTPTQIYA